MTLSHSSGTRSHGQHALSTSLLVTGLCFAVLLSCTGSSELNKTPSPVVLADHHVDWDPDSGHAEAEEVRRHALGAMLATPSPATRFAFARASFPAPAMEPERLSTHDALHVALDSNALSVETKGRAFRISTADHAFNSSAAGEFVALGPDHFLSKRSRQPSDTSWSADRIEEFWIADHASGERSATYDVEVPVGITTIRGTGEYIEFFDDAGLPVLRFHGVVARDARGHLRRGTLQIGGVEEAANALRLLGSRVTLSVAVPLDGLAPPIAIDPEWSTTSTMAMTRDRHTATLLPNGRVLVAGGNNSTFGSTSTAELFDPTTSTWQSAGAMSVDRYGATATLLPSGLVLVVGGYSTSSASTIKETTKVDLYDPVRNAWSAERPLSTGRVWHTATALSDGRVLVTGGQQGTASGNPTFLDTTAFYSPSTGQWSSSGTDSLAVARAGHTATLVASGKVVVTGGRTSIGQTATAEIFDPAIGSWSAASNMTFPRDDFSAVLLPTGLPTGRAASVMVVGGGTFSSQAYDPAVGTWSSTGALPNTSTTPVSGSCTALLTNGTVLVAGGVTSTAEPTNAAWLFNPTTNSWSAPSGSALAVPRSFATATVLPTGRVLVVGGQQTATSWRNDAELFDPRLGSWDTKKDLFSTLRGHTATVMQNGQLLIVGGSKFSSTSAAAVGDAWLYTPGTKTLTGTNPLPSGEERANHLAVVLRDGRVLVTGGVSNGVATKTTEIFNPTAGTWANAAWLNVARWGAAAVLLDNGTVLVAGGTSGAASSAETYDPATDVWTNAGTLSTARSFPNMVLLPDGKVLLAGGTTTAGAPGAELYDPVSRSWSAIQGTFPAKTGMTLSRLASGRVLAVGGVDSTGTLDDNTYLYSQSGGWVQLGASSKLTPARKNHSAVLLPSGKVAVFGGTTILPDTVASVFDPATNLWTTLSSLTDARSSETATLLSDGTIIVIGGLSSSSVLSTYEVFDDASAQAGWKPVIDASSVASLQLGTTVTITGSRFRGVSSATGGATKDSASNHPLVSLMSLDGSQVWNLPTSEFSATSFKVGIPNVTTGRYLLSVMVNGIWASALTSVSPPPLQLPIAQDRSVATNEDTTVPVTLSATNGAITGWSAVGFPQHGALLNFNGPQLTYRPDPDYNGPDSFQFTATSPNGTSAPATVSVTVGAVNDPPTLNAIPDVTIAESSGPQSMTLSGLTAGPIDESGQTLSLTVSSDNAALVPTLGVTGVAGGVATLNYSLLAYASGSALVTVTVRDNGGIANGGVDTTVRTFRITVFPVNDTPTLDPVSDLTVLENAGLQTVSLTGITAGAPNESAQMLIISAVNDNPGLLGSLTVTPLSGSSSSIQFTPTANQYGSGRITVTVKDSGGTANGGIDTVTRTFRVTVSFVNQRPTINTVNDVTVLENSGAHSLNLSGIAAGPSSELAQQLTITVLSDNPTVVPTPTLSPITNGTSQLTFTPALNQFGAATVTVKVRDDGGGNDTVTASFHVNVTAVNQPPTVRPLNDVIIPQNSAPLIVGITGIAAGPANESSQVITITAVSDNATVVPNPVVASVSSSSSTLTIQPAMNQIGLARVTVTVKDNGGLANGGVDSVSVTFTVTVVPVNQAPVIDAIGNLTVAENSGARSITLTGIAPGPAIESSQQLMVTATSSNPALMPDPTVSAVAGGTASLTFAPVANQNGFAVITVTLHDDGGTGSGGQDTTTRTFIVTVTPFVNVAPTLDPIADVTVAENSGSTDISLTGITPGPPTESAQHLTITATSSNPTLVANPTVSAVQGDAAKVTFMTASNRAGFAVVTVTVKDDAGTRNNGSDTTTRVFSITVTPFVNQPPTMDTVLPVTVLENTGSHTVTLTGISSGPAGEAGQQIIVTAKSNAPGVIPDPTLSPIVNGTATLTFESLPDQSGVVAITLTLQDDGGTRNGGSNTTKQTFAIVVETVNQAPTLDPITDITLNENAGEQTITLTGLTPGPITEMAQGLTVTATSSDPTVVANVVVGALTGTTAPLTFESLPFAFGSTTITLTVKDDGGTTSGGVDTASRTFVITVLSVNQPPTVDAIDDLIILENAPQQTIVLRGLGTGPENESAQHLAIVATSSNPILIADPTITPGDLTTLQFKPAFDTFGETTITLTVSDDGGVERDGADAIERKFKVTVLPVNHAPTIDPIEDVEVLADGIIRQLKITGLSPGPANESMQTLDVSAVSAEDTVATIHSVTRESDGTATLRFIPVGIGTTQVTVTVLDNGGMENEGIDRTHVTFTVHAGASRKQLGGCGCSGLDGTGRTEFGLLMALGFLLRRRQKTRTA